MVRPAGLSGCGSYPAVLPSRRGALLGGNRGSFLKVNYQKGEMGEVLAGRPASEASIAAVEMGVEEDRTCPRCGAHGAMANGKSRGLQRYLCRSCNRTFGAVTNTPMDGLHRKEIWLTYGECLANGDTVAVAAERCDIAVSAVFRWRHRLLARISTNTEKLTGIVEAYETFFSGKPQNGSCLDTGQGR